jgi:hypothetical protein
MPHDRETSGSMEMCFSLQIESRNRHKTWPLVSIYYLIFAHPILLARYFDKYIYHKIEKKHTYAMKQRHLIY